MSDRQNLAEHGVGLCIAGLAVAGLAATPALTALPSVAIFAAWGIDRYKRCKNRRTRDAVTQTIKALETSGASTRGITAALHLLKENKDKVRITATDLADKTKRNDFPDALYDIVFKDTAVPTDDGVEHILRQTLNAAYATLRLEDDFDKIFVQESVTEISRALDTGFADMAQNLDRLQDTAEDTNARVRDMQETLANLTAASRDQLEALANRFQIEDVFDRSDTDLRELLAKKAMEYRALKAEVDSIPESMKRLANLKSAAQDAIARVDLDEVENLMTLVHTTELEEAAKSAEIRADNALLRENVEHAFSLLSAAADSFAAIDPLEPARRRIKGSHKGFPALYTHGLRYGGTGLSKAAQLVQEVLSDALREKDDILWAAGQNNLAVALKNLGIRTDGKKGTDLLAQAVAAYRAALEVRTFEKHPLDWAKTQNNLGLVLRHQGTREDQAKATALLAEAVSAYRAALVVQTRTEHPVEWAQTVTNLANALKDEGIRTHDSKGAQLIAEAASSYCTAFEVYTRRDHPIYWAGTHNHLGTVLREQGRRAEGPRGMELLREAIAAYENALQVRTRSNHPVQWAETHENIARTYFTIACHNTCTDPRAALTEALTAVDAALTVFDPDHMSYNHTKATRLRTEILAQLGVLA